MNILKTLPLFNKSSPLPVVNEKLSVAINDKYGQQLKNCGIGYINKVDGIFKEGYIKVFKEFSLNPENAMGVYGYMPINLDPFYLILIDSGHYEVRVVIDPLNHYDLTLKRVSLIVERAISCYQERFNAIESWNET